MVHRRFTVASLVLILFAGACTSTDEGLSAGEPADFDPISSDAGEATFDVETTATQITVTGTEPETEIALYDGDEATEVGTSDTEGALIFRELDAGNYRVATTGDDQVATDEVNVPTIEESLPEQSTYDGQVLEQGYQYITTRDGTQLAVSVFLPGPPEDGPYPTVVEYSGYDPAKPGTNLLEDAEDTLENMGISSGALCQTLAWLCDAPAQPGSTIARAMDYAVVAVNVRGTGCSGGAYDFFDVPQLLDGYDVIETVAAQPWVKHGKVGMVGLSYPGISQLFVARTQPPGLAAITPQSVTDDTVRGLLAPGGIFNEGFALSWTDEVLEKAEPLGQGWEEDRIEDGDEVCAENQKLRGQNVDVVEKALDYTYYPPKIGDFYNPSVFGSDIEVPLMLTGAFGDEQTGPRFSHLFDKFPNSPVTKFGMWNGVHADGFSPQGLAELKTFLDLYVNQEVPTDSPILSLLGPIISEDTFGVALPIPAVRYSDFATVSEAQAAYEAEPDVRLVWQSGGIPDQAGAPVGTNTYFLDSWPPSDTEAQAFYLTNDASMVSAEPTNDDGAASSFNFDEELASTVTLETDNTSDIFKTLPDYDWRQEPEGSAAVFVSEPLEEDLVMFGPASADLWIRSSAAEADIGVTLSEVRPDGKETLIQSGHTRGTLRKLDEAETELWPAHRGYEEDAEPMPVGEFTEVRVEVMPFAHVLRADSRVRMSVHTPGGDRPRWTYILSEGQDGAVFDVGHSVATPSRLVLPTTELISGYPQELPPCPGLRGQPCREFAEYTNTPTD